MAGAHVAENPRVEAVAAAPQNILIADAVIVSHFGGEFNLSERLVDGDITLEQVRSALSLAAGYGARGAGL